MKPTLTLLTALLLTPLAALHSATSEPDKSTSVSVEVRAGGSGKTQLATFYRTVRCGDLTVTILPDKAKPKESPVLQVMGPQTPLYTSERATIGDPTPRGDWLVLPPQFIGQPSLHLVKFRQGKRTVRFEVNKPVRLYAWLDAPAGTPLPPEWQPYLRDPFLYLPLMYRDFPAGEQAFELDGTPCTGVFIAQDALTAEDKLVFTGRGGADREPEITLANFGPDARRADVRFTFYTPPQTKPVAETTASIEAAAGKTATVRVPLPKTEDGVVYVIHAQATAGDERRETWLIHGRYPVPSDKTGLGESAIPFGGYLKLQASHDVEFYEHALRATLYQMRRMAMNVAVLEGNDARAAVLDVMHAYGIRAIVRMGSKDGRFMPVPDEIAKHPALLTLMIGDEPTLKEDFDKYLALFARAKEQWPTMRPITCAIYDSWGTMDEHDPVLIYGAHLAKFNPTMFGRYYPFRKENFGLLNGIGYKGWLDPRNFARAIGGSGWKDWWMAPAFFGHQGATPFWRIPTGEELKGLAHLSLAHGCRGFIGWALHCLKEGKVEQKSSRRDGLPFDQNYRIQSVGFDGITGAPSVHQRHAALAEIGRELAKATPALAQRTDLGVQLSSIEPYQIEASAHWTRQRQIQVYAVNLDHRNAHTATIRLYCGDGEAGAAMHEEVRELTEVYTGAQIAFERERTPDGIRYLTIKLPDLPPGEGRLIVCHGADKGAFTGKVMNPKMLQQLERLTELGELRGKQGTK